MSMSGDDPDPAKKTTGYGGPRIREGDEDLAHLPGDQDLDYPSEDSLGAEDASDARQIERLEQEVSELSIEVEELQDRVDRLED
jgi:hypothetical protein